MVRRSGLSVSERGRGWDRIDQVAVGGESGPGARPMHPDWVRALRYECRLNGVAFFFKQIGEWAWVKSPQEATHFLTIEGFLRELHDGHSLEDSDVLLARRGKKAAGRMLDGRTWDQYPETLNSPIILGKGESNAIPTNA